MEYADSTSHRQPHSSSSECIIGIFNFCHSNRWYYFEPVPQQTQGFSEGASDGGHAPFSVGVVGASGYHLLQQQYNKTNSSGDSSAIVDQSGVYLVPAGGTWKYYIYIRQHKNHHRVTYFFGYIILLFLLQQQQQQQLKDAATNCASSVMLDRRPLQDSGSIRVIHGWDAPTDTLPHDATLQLIVYYIHC